MVTLAHQSLLSLIRSGAKIDYEDPIINDQFFSAGVTFKNHTERVRKLRHELNQFKDKVRRYSNFKNIAKVNYTMIDKVTTSLSSELFDNLRWKDVKTASQAIWKEYFHSVYDLLVPDYSDHIGNLIMANEIIKYHDVIDPPSIPIDPKDTRIHVIKGLLDSLKREQLSVARGLGDIKFQINETNRHTNEIQGDIIRIQREIKMLTDEMAIFSEITLSKLR
jgi:hypothetical protein